MADNACSVDMKVDYLHPELLSIEVLLEILKERKVLEDEPDVLDKYKLVELFYDHVMPFPQRTYGSSRREQRLARHQKSKESLKRKNESADNNEDGKAIKVHCVGSNSLMGANRLKPPPSHTNGSTIVKLTSSGPSHNYCLSNNLTKATNMLDKSQLSDISPTKKRKFQPISWP